MDSVFAFLITGEIRTLDKTWYSILNNMVKPNKATLFFQLQLRPEQKGKLKYYEDYIKEKFKGYVGYIHFMTEEEFKSFIQLRGWLFASKPGLAPEIVNKRGIKDYLLTSGSIIEYFHLLKAHEALEQYERDHKVKFQIVARSRCDVTFTRPINFLDFWGIKSNLETKSDPKSDPKFDPKFDDQVGKLKSYIGSMGMNSRLDQIGDLKSIYVPSNLTENPVDQWHKMIGEMKIVWAFRSNVIWITTRNISKILSDTIYHYGDRVSNSTGKYIGENVGDTWNAERQLDNVCLDNEILKFDHFTKSESDYSFPTKPPDLPAMIKVGDHWELNPKLPKDMDFILLRY